MAGERYAILHIWWRYAGRSPHTLWGLWKSYPDPNRPGTWDWHKIAVPGETFDRSTDGDGVESKEEIEMYLESIGVDEFEVVDRPIDFDVLSRTGKFAESNG